MATKKQSRPLPYYLSKDKKFLIVDFDKITPAEERAVALMAAGKGLIVKPKREGKKGESLTFDDMREALKNEKKYLDLLEKYIAEKKNYFKIKKWFKSVIEQVEKKPTAPQTQTQAQ